jgi:hypothetical protein
MGNSSSRRIILQARISKLLLDAAERTQWQWGPFKEMNRIRAEQRVDAQSFYKTYHLPAGVGIRMKTLTIIELISPDELSSFKEVLLGALRHTRGDAEDFERSYRSIIEGSFRGGFMRVGRIERRGVQGGEVRSTISELLPTGVRFLDLEIRKVFSSLALLYITAGLDDSVTDEIVETIGTPTLPVFRITKLSIKKPWITGWRSTGPNVRQEVALRLNNLANEIIQLLRIDRIHERMERLPVQRIRPLVAYSIEKGPETSDQIKTWLQQNGSWLDALGIETIPFLLFSDQKSVFAWSSSSRSSEYHVPHHMLIFQNLSGKDWYRLLRIAVRSVAPAVGILDWTESSIHDVEELRNAAFRLIKSKKPKFRRSFHRYFRLNEIVQLQTMSVERLSQQISEEFSQTLTESGTTDFVLLHTDVEKFMGKNLAEAIIASVDRFVKVLRTQASYVHRTFSEFISMRNMEASFRIQRLVVLLTVVTLLISVPTLLPILKTIRDYLVSVFAP